MTAGIATPVRRPDEPLDTLTHALSGALLATTLAARGPRPGRPPRGTCMVAGLAAAAFPDIDVALRVFGTLPYLNAHQGLTHSLVALPLWAWLLSWLSARFAAGRYGWQAFYAICAAGIAIHIAGDLITAYGTRLLAPLSEQRYALSLSFVIDPWFSAIILGGLVASGLRPRRPLVPVAALAVLVAYVGLQAGLQQRALDVARRHLPASAGPAAGVHALPQPYSPSRWLLLVETVEGYDVATVDLFGARDPGGRPGTVWTSYPRYGATPEEATLARTAWQRAEFAAFREFAVFPILDAIERGPERTCAWFADLRFLLPGSPPSFRHGLCQASGAGAWRIERKPGAYWID